MLFEICNRISGNISKVIVGKEDSIRLLLIALLAEGHALIDDVPGLGKTLLAKSLAKSIGAKFERVQFTPDLLPSDITGFNVYDQQSCRFVFQPGPVMTNVLLADEINRTIPRTQSSLLESMEERQVTVDGTTYPLPPPFFVIATQNPIELEGTFPLPEAQLDRFLLKVRLGYPGEEEEMAILERFQEKDPLAELGPVASTQDILDLQAARRKVHVSAPVIRYITAIVMSNRDDPSLLLVVSPRGYLDLMKEWHALAALEGRNYVLPDDIKHLVLHTLAHRIILNDEERLRGRTAEHLLEETMRQVPVPIPAEA